MTFETKRPEKNNPLRQKIYQGCLYKIPANSFSQRLITDVKQDLKSFFKVDLATVHVHLSNEIFLQKLHHIRQKILAKAYTHKLNALISSLGFAPCENALDPLRLRCVKHDMHKNPDARIAYTAHRDTWFGNPQNQINWWIPLHDISEEQSFKFYPGFFDRPIVNNSEHFDFYRLQKNGWQTPKKHKIEAIYPEVLDPLLLEKKGLKFTCKAGDIILFSGAQLHQTHKNSSGHSRFSLDFRTVHLDDFAHNIGAPNVDNKSQPEALSDYLFPQQRGV